MPRAPDEIIQFAEQFGLAAEAAGWTRIAGKVLAFLIVCQPAEQSPANLRQALMISKASVSIVVRFLLERGLIERVSHRGDRKTYLRIAQGAWGTLLVSQLRGVARFQRLAEQAVGLADGTELAARARADEMAMFYQWWAAEAPRLTARWNAHRARCARARASPGSA
jgi:hypothetical protein